MLLIRALNKVRFLRHVIKANRNADVLSTVAGVSFRIFLYINFDSLTLNQCKFNRNIIYKTKLIHGFLGKQGNNFSLFYLLKNSCSQVVECASHIHPSQILQTSNFACNRLFFCSSAQQQQ